ncbi:MAG TPA: hypothetical protein VLF60_00395 [Candidatus Saccharimonadales bacterium]|nr:hypothetical protein [Candidatus Saccharimonadales bacterium]
MKAYFTKATCITAGVGLLVGALLILGIRFATYHPEKIHYHANFGVYINGQREGFKSPLYYQEEATCDAEHIMTPKERVHMHDNVYDAIHIHDHAVTWGNFFQNIGWDIGPNFVKTSDKLLPAADSNSVTFILNGKTVYDVTNRVIGDKDRLLVSYGNTTQDDLQKQYNSISTSAAKYDTDKDPASCGGSAGPTAKDRFKHLF